MLLRTLRVSPIVLFGLLGAIVGCSGPTAQKPVYAVNGKLTCQGKPMDRAQITFRLADDPNPRALGILARADANGAYQVTTYKRFDGLPAGDYVVTIQWPEARSNKSGLEEAESEDEIPPDRLKGAHSDPTKSKLRVTVGPRSNQIDFTLP